MIETNGLDPLIGMPFTKGDRCATRLSMGKRNLGQKIASGFSSKRPDSFSEYTFKEQNIQPECWATNCFKSNSTDSHISIEVERIVAVCHAHKIITSADWKAFMERDRVPKRKSEDIDETLPPAKISRSMASVTGGAPADSSPKFADDDIIEMDQIMEDANDEEADRMSLDSDGESSRGEALETGGEEDEKRTSGAEVEGNFDSQLEQDEDEEWPLAIERSVRQREAVWLCPGIYASAMLYAIDVFMLVDSGVGLSSSAASSLA